MKHYFYFVLIYMIFSLLESLYRYKGVMAIESITGWIFETLIVFMYFIPIIILHTAISDLLSKVKIKNLLKIKKFILFNLITIFLASFFLFFNTIKNDMYRENILIIIFWLLMPGIINNLIYYNTNKKDLSIS